MKHYIPWRTRVTLSDGGQYWMIRIPHWWDKWVGWLWREYHVCWLEWDAETGFHCGWGRAPDDAWWEK